MERRHALRDDQWEHIKGLLPGRDGHVGVTARDNRLFVDALLYHYRLGSPWCDLPECFGHFRAVHLRHSRWSRMGVWLRILKILSRDADNEYAMIDATVLRAHQHSAGERGGAKQQAIGRSRGGLGGKLHAMVDVLGNPTGFHLTPGQAHDLEGADALLPQMQVEVLIANKAYDAQERVIELLSRAGKGVVIPSRSTNKQQRSYDRHL